MKSRAKPTSWPGWLDIKDLPSSQPPYLLLILPKRGRQQPPLSDAEGHLDFEHFYRPSRSYATVLPFVTTKNVVAPVPINRKSTTHTGSATVNRSTTIMR